MVHEILLFKLKAGKSSEVVEDLMVESRIRLLKLPEVQKLACGKPINTDEQSFDFFLNLEYENMTKRALVMDSPQYVQFEVQILKPNTTGKQAYLFESEPGKDVRYS
ncbi:MAG: Dabb family protein [Verrucomicrobiota bacterium]